jgi:DNA mismatch endonuclease (patch repair protein)
MAGCDGGSPCKGGGASGRVTLGVTEKDGVGRLGLVSKCRGRELGLTGFFRANRIIGWRRHWRAFGRPDFVFPRLKLAVFVDECFWHACPAHSNLPVGNRSFWQAKLGANRRRDRLVRRTLESRGWRVLRIWEHELTRRNQGRLLSRLRQALEPKSQSRAGQAD